MRAFLKAMAGGLLSAVIFAAALELGLRLVPAAIPLALLEHFEPDLRAHIASRRKLTTKEDTVLVPRADGGPADRLWIYRPEAEIHYDFDEPRIVRQVRVDKQGFCNPDPDAYADTPRFDVIVVGDSFSWCLAVEPSDTWPSRFARLTGLSTYNLGHPGRGLYEHLQLLQTFGLAKSPRMVVMNMYEGNDFRDAFYFYKARTDGGSAVARQACPFDSATACDWVGRVSETFLGRHSYAYNLLTAALWQLAASADKKEIDFHYQVRFSDGSSLGMNSQNADRDEVEFAQRLEDGRLEVTMFDAGLAEFRRLADQWGFVPILLYTPSAYTAYEGMTTFDDPGIERTMRNYSKTLRRYFAAKAGELGFRYLDLTPHLAAAAQASNADDLLYFRTNVHFTQSGHQLVAAQLAELIRDELDLGSGGGRDQSATGLRRPANTP
jgi:hypothetical protein